MRRPRLIVTLSVVALVISSACSVLPQAPTPTPTRAITAPTLEASPTARIRTSDELYGSATRSGYNDPTAAALPNSGALPPLASGTEDATGAEPVEVVLEDGEIISATLYRNLSDAGNRVPGVLVVGEEALAWALLPADIHAAGFNVMIVPLPVTPDTADMETLLTSFSEAGTVDPARIAIVGAAEAADFALRGCAFVQMCDAAVLLSPGDADAVTALLPELNPRPLFVAAGQDDTASYDTARALAAGFADNSRFAEYATGRGANLLALNSQLSREIVTWLTERLELAP